MVAFRLDSVLVDRLRKIGGRQRRYTQTEIVSEGIRLILRKLEKRKVS